MNNVEIKKEFEEIKKEFKKFGIKIGNPLGEGKFGFVREMKFKNKSYAGKLEKKEGKNNECDLILQFKSPNIVKIVKIFDINSGFYYLILMEKALKDLNDFIKQSEDNSLQKLIIDPFYDGIIGDILFKYFAKNIIIGLESLERIGYFHFDIKPGNILMFKNLVLKLSDFNFLRDQKQEKKNNMITIPGGTHGYSPPEYYIINKATIENAKKHDYFSLGSTLFILKYGKKLFSFPKSCIEQENKKKTQIINYIYVGIERQMNLIKSSKLSDKGFINFLCSLVQYKPEDRPNFEEIYRNNWLNKDSEYISKIVQINENENEKDDSKLLLELNKSDFLLIKAKNLNKERKKFVFKKKRK